MPFSRIDRVDRTGSTNSDVLAALSADRASFPHLAVLAAREQAAGRGRSGRAWSGVPGASLACSVVIDDDGLPLTWVPLLVGLAVRRALRPWVLAGLKWPNDVVLAGAPAPAIRAGTRAEAGGAPAGGSAWGWPPKLGGILCERHAGGAVVAGIGINCRERAEELPVPWAASIATATGTPGPGPDEVLLALGDALPAVLENWHRDPRAPRAEYEDASVVLGEDIRVAGAGAEVSGRAAGIDDDGALLVEAGGALLRVTAGDVGRLRR